MRLSTSYRPRKAREGQGEGVTERPIISQKGVYPTYSSDRSSMFSGGIYFPYPTAAMLA